jgi:hypothetical protein
MKKLRLLLTEECNRSCEGCCNNDWDLQSLNQVDWGALPLYKEVMITGGEPMLKPKGLFNIVSMIRAYAFVPIYLYTAKTNVPLALVAALAIVDGITLTIHEQADVNNFVEFWWYAKQLPDIKQKSLRLNIFKGIDMSNVNTRGWKIQDEMVWMKDCPLPTDEIFQRVELGQRIN